MPLFPKNIETPPEIRRSSDSPAARVEWHLACFEAKRLGNPLPPAPWETGEGREGKSASIESEPRTGLTLPSRPKRSATRRTPAEGPREDSREKQKERIETIKLPTRASNHHEETAPARHDMPSPAPVPAPRIKIQPVSVPLFNEKLEIVSSLLLRAGIPHKIALQDGRARAVLDNLTLYLQCPTAQMLHKYDLGRQFIARGGVREANQAADIVLPLLLSQTARELTARISKTEYDIAEQILPLNVPGPSVEIPKRSS